MLANYALFAGGSEAEYQLHFVELDNHDPEGIDSKFDQMRVVRSYGAGHEFCCPCGVLLLLCENYS
jgi:hypothetical protein